MCDLYWLTDEQMADRGYDADWFRDALEQKGIKPCIPGHKSARRPSDTTSGGKNEATASRSCSAV